MRHYGLLLFLFLLAGLITNGLSTALDKRANPALSHSTKKVYADWVNDSISTLGGQPGYSILAIGASQTYFGISPAAIDAEFEKRGVLSTTYNMAFPALEPTSVELLARHFDANWGDQEPLDIMIVGFAPHFHTYKYAQSEAFGFYNMVLRAHLKPGLREIVFLHQQSINDGFQSLAMQLLNVEPGRPQKIFMELFSGAEPRECMTKFPGNRGGEPCYGLGKAPLKIEHLRQLAIAHRNMRVEQADLLDLKLDPRALEHVVQTIDIAKRFSKKVFLALTPRNIDIVDTTPEGLKRLRAGLSYISEKTGVEVIDFYSKTTGYDLERFNDATHLNAEGARFFSTELAQILGHYLMPENSDS